MLFLRIYAILIFAFLYFPIAIIVAFSFNAGRYAMDWQGFSFQWYATAWNNPFVMNTLKNSLIAAGGSSIIAVIVGTAAALGIARIGNATVRQLFDSLVYLALIVPGIVIGIATLVAAVTVFNALNPVLGSIFGGDSPPKLQLGLWTVIASHALGNMAVVVVFRMPELGHAIIFASFIEFYQ